MAIAFDAVSHGVDGSGTSLSWSHTCTGSNLILFVAALVDTSHTVTSVTYNGVAMTQIASVDAWTRTALYYLVAPATGTNTVTITASGNNPIYGRATSYTGASQTGVPDSFSTNTGTGTTSLNLTTTVVANNSWLVGCIGNDSNTQTAGSNTTIRYQLNGWSIIDSNGAQASGSRSMNCTFASGTVGGVIASFAPYVAPAYTGGLLGFN